MYHFIHQDLSKYLNKFVDKYINKYDAQKEAGQAGFLLLLFHHSQPCVWADQ